MHEEMISTANVVRFPSAGPPLIVWHGLARRWQDYAALLPWFATRWSITAVDHRGHGKSARTPGAYLVPDYVADAVKLLKGINAGPAVLYGHSLGALVAMGVAAECPELVRGIVLEDPPAAKFLTEIAGTGYAVTWQTMKRVAGRKDIPTMARELADAVLPNGKHLGDLRAAPALRFLATCLADLDPDTLTAPLAGTWLAGFDPLTVAARVTCPALLLAADPVAGGMMPTADSADLMRAFPDGLRVDFPGCGHLLHGEHPTAVATAVLPFMESLS